MSRIEDDYRFKLRGGSYEGPVYRPKPWPPVVASQRVAAPVPSDLDRARVRTEHDLPDIRPLCPRCRRPFDPDCRLQHGIAEGFCYHCAPLDWASVTEHLRAMDEYDQEQTK